MNQNNVTFVMKFDPSDLKSLAAQISAIFGTTKAAAAPAGGGGAGIGGGGGVGGASGGGSALQFNPSFMSIFKPIAALEAIKKGIEFIVRNSSVANTYLGAMGKVFGAAIDLILIPFTPIFNLLLVGLAKLVEWLSREDVQKFLEKISKYIMDALGYIWKQIEKYFPIVLNQLEKLVQKIIDLIEDVRKFFGDNHVPDRVERAKEDTQNFLTKNPIGKIVRKFGEEVFINQNPVIGGAKRIYDIGRGGNILENLLPYPLNKGVSKLPIPNVDIFGTLEKSLTSSGVYKYLQGDRKQLPVWLQPNKQFEQSMNSNSQSVIVQQALQVTINIHDQTDGKKIAEVFQDEMRKLGRNIRLG